MVQQSPTHSGEGTEWIGVHAQDPEQLELFEQMVDKHLPWIPIHRVRKNRSLCWTHYLCQDGTIKVLKCKHCGGLIAHIGKDRSSTSRFRSHLKHHHRIDPNSDYYMGPCLLPTAVRAPAQGGNNNSNSNRHNNNNNSNASLSAAAVTETAAASASASLSSPSSFSSDSSVSAPSRRPVHSGRPFKVENPGRERRTVLRTELLLGIMTASQDLRQRFFDNDVVKELLARLSDFDTLDLPAAISHTAQDIDDIICRTIVCNDRHMAQRFVVNGSMPMHAVKLQISERMHTLSQMTFFAVSYRHWVVPDISAWGLTFCDPLEFRQYCIVADVAAGGDGAAAGMEQLRARYPGLGRYLVSYMEPQPQPQGGPPAGRATGGGGSAGNVCAVTELHRCFSQIFGEDVARGAHVTEGGSCAGGGLGGSSAGASGNVAGSAAADTIMSLQHIRLTNPLLLQIQDFSNNSKNEWQTSISKFDLANYSTLTESITSLLKLRPLLDILDPQPFTPGNYLDMVHFTDVVQSFNRAFQFFTCAPQQTWQFTLLAVVALDENLSQTLEEVGSVAKFSNHLENCVSSISRFKRRLLANDWYVLASFLVPTTLFDDQLLEVLFDSDSLPTIVGRAVEMIYQLSKDYFDLVVASPYVDSAVGDSAATEAKQRASIITSPEELAVVIRDVIRDDIYAYLNIVNDVVPMAFQAHCSSLGITKSVDGSESAVYKRNDTPLSSLDTFLDIHVPIARRFHLEKWNALGQSIRFVLKVLNSQPGSTISSANSFLADYKPISGDDMLVEVLKVKSLDLQFNTTKIDFDHDNLSLVCKYASRPDVAIDHTT
ncbi:Vid22p Ecym_2767 [Eremothecium cymbalariae DBVPG|uniref:BED-type domain-containing protein n=1 Tax=Eremothecium cymbalariae (strain CBS 270.75 / DBVPG 7215 / KCTC 17166 / NRRL Y-17582) TaxID=931890 RepID=G8JQ03_ERECY|nr:Hypothetical protein Ecym_2767 [Eremothecium cymbalariae DBVPG\